MDFEMSQALAALEQMIMGFSRRLPYIAVGLVTFVIFYFAGKGLRRLIRRVTERRKKHRNVGFVLGRLAQAITVLIGLLVAMVIILPNFKPTQLVEFLGITSVAIGFAFRDILQNFLAGILLLLTEPFRLDDQIKVGEFEGTVEDIRARATLIRTFDNRLVVIPNGDLFTKSVIVNTAFETRRLEYDFGIGYGDDTEKAKEIILQTLRDLDMVLKDPVPDVLVMELGPSSVSIRTRWWIQPPRRADALDARDQVIGRVKRNLLANGIDLPFPTQHVLFHDQTEVTDGDRARQREGWPAGKGEVPGSRSIAGAIKQLTDRLDQFAPAPGRRNEHSEPPPKRWD